jgi:acyl-CoA synthetase (NDP forming)
MIVEHFRHPRRFLAAAARARLGKHIVLLHPGRSAACACLGRDAHRRDGGRLPGDAHQGFSRWSCRRRHTRRIAGCLRDIGSLPISPSGGAAVLTESGAFKALTLDFCDALGLPLPALGDDTAAALRSVLPDFIPPTNPLDVTAQALVDPGLYGRTLPLILNDDRYGSLVLAIILTDEATSRLKFPRHHRAR